MPIRLGWILFFLLWFLSLTEVVAGSPHTPIWNLSVILVFVIMVFSFRKYVVYRRELAFLREFHHLSQAMDEIRVLNPQQAFADILGSIVRIVGFDRAMLFVKDSGQDVLRAVSAHNLAEDIFTQMVIPKDRGPSLAWRVLDTATPEVVNTPHNHPEIDQRLLQLMGSQTLAYVPICRGNQGMGVIIVDRHLSKKPISDEDLLQLQVLADQVSVTLKNLSLHREITQKAEVLEQQSRRLQKELQLARIVQESALPRESPDWPDLTFAHLLKSARFIGGDFFSFISGCHGIKSFCPRLGCRDCPDRSLGILIGDVCGKGIPAAMVMAMIISLFHEKALQSSDPAEILRQVNLAMKRYLGAETRFNSSAFLGFFQPTRGVFVYANAGHDYPLMYSRKSGVISALESTGTLLGIFRESEYSTREVPMETGDRIFFYTDGLLDYFERVQGHEDGVGEMMSLVRNSLTQPPAAMIAALDAVLSGCDREIQDDITAVMMMVN